MEIFCDGSHILHRKGDKEYNPDLRRMCVLAEDIANYEEIAVEDIPAQSEADYKARVISLIRARYDADDEIALLRQRDTKPDEYAAYNAYVEQCKAEARAEIAEEKELAATESESENEEQ